MRSRRSCLSVPASSAKMLAKARSLPADEIVIDLEDSVTPDAKEAARSAACAAIAGDWGGRAVAVRVNGTDSEWWERDVTELAAADGAALDSLVIPKCETAAQIQAVERLLEETEDSAGSGRPVGLQALIETAAGLVRVGEIAGAGSRLETLIVGYADLGASLGRPPEGEYPGDRWHWVRETVLVHARAAGLAAIDGPYLDVSGGDGLRSSAESARALGYDGKWAIHPSQLDPLNEIFSPTPEEYERARAVLEALAAAGERGAVQLDGEMIDEASRKHADQLIARAEAAGLGASGD
ncbi:MAG: HpcH/HpaI aldolase/citrate lyase family protein [Solirubrobacterales bacterium]